MLLLNEINDTCIKLENQTKELAQQKSETEIDNLRIKEALGRLSDDVA